MCRENSKYAPDESFGANFALAERLPTSATLNYAYIEGVHQFYHLKKGITGLKQGVTGYNRV